VIAVTRWTITAICGKRDSRDLNAGSQASMYRVPTTRVDPGDLIATPDAPLVTLFMQDIADVRGIQGIDPQPIESKSMCDQRISSISNSS
jgi:hypothetical protein